MGRGDDLGPALPGLTLLGGDAVADVPNHGRKRADGGGLCEQVFQFELQGTEEVVPEVGLHGFAVRELFPHPDEVLVVGVGGHRVQRGTGFAVVKGAGVVTQDPNELVPTAWLRSQLN
jgi:hypothetical protein